MLLAIALVSGLAAGSCQQTLAVTIDTGQSVKLDDGRELRLALVSYPVILYGENATISFQFRLFQGNTNQTIPHVTYYVELADATKEDDEPLLQELFHSHGGPLVLKINPDNSQFVTIRGQRDLIYNAWLAGNHTNTVNIDAPAKTFDTGLFKVHADTIGIDRDGHAFEEDDIPAFDVYLSIGRALTRQVSFMDNSYDIAIISYYDKIQEFKFNADRREFYWSMPFNWDLTHLNNTKNLFIHQDVRVPKSLIQLSLNGSDPANDVIMNATVNGFLLHGS